MKKILLIMFCVILISFVSANPVADFWESKGLSPGEAKSISENTATKETIAKAELLQNETYQEQLKEQLNITAEKKQQKNRQGIGLMIFLGLMTLGSVIVVVGLFAKGGAS